MTAQRICPPSTAFSLSTGRKRPRKESGDHLKFIRACPCLITGRYDNVEAAHVRYGDQAYGKRDVGLSEKPDDRWALPLHRDMHRDQHARGERDWWQHIGIDPLAVCCALWAASGDVEAAELILKGAREKRKEAAK